MEFGVQCYYSGLNFSKQSRGGETGDNNCINLVHFIKCYSSVKFPAFFPIIHEICIGTYHTQIKD